MKWNKIIDQHDRR